ncbi:MAG: carbohydrate porin [Pseudomonadota bacterium]|nr:carbohydrate porin [Pseudomonadota bacterium]
MRLTSDAQLRAAGLAILLLWTVPAVAQPAPAGVWERGNLLGDIGGLRPTLGRYGASFGLNETSEVLGNPTGGVKQGVIYEGLTQMSLGIDLAKAIGLPGGIFNASAFQIHGRGLTINNIDNLNIVSGIEADRSTRLYELWYQQSFLAGKVDIRIGNLAADEEFIIDPYATPFLNEGFGWPTLPSVDLPSGGPAYPFGTPGVRLRALPTANTTVLLGVFNGDPAGPGVGDPQIRDRSGTNFSLNGGTLVIGEVQYAVNQGENAKGLPATYKIGAWYGSNAFTNQLFSDQAIAVAAPNAASPPMLRGDWSAYATLDQLVFRPEGAKDAGLGLFVRAMGAPFDRSQVAVYVDGGLSYKGPFGRDGDTVGVVVEWAKISNASAAADRVLAASTGGRYPVRTAETVIELTYQAQVAPWWQVQPDFQYVFNPSGGILNPNGSGRTVRGAAVLGLRTVVTF